MEPSTRSSSALRLQKEKRGKNPFLRLSVTEPGHSLALEDGEFLGVMMDGHSTFPELISESGSHRGLGSQAGRYRTRTVHVSKQPSRFARCSAH